MLDGALLLTAAHPRTWIHIVPLSTRATRKVVFPVQGWLRDLGDSVLVGGCCGWRESGGARLPVTVGSDDVAVACRG